MTVASGIGLATVHSSGTVLDVWYPAPALSALTQDAALSARLEALAVADPDRGTQGRVVTVETDLSAAPVSTEDAYLRLHLLSHRL